jgi:hypothetical protein
VSLRFGTRPDPYEILAPLGSEGMGAVEIGREGEIRQGGLSQRVFARGGRIGPWTARSIAGVPAPGPGQILLFSSRSAR